MKRVQFALVGVTFDAARLKHALVRLDEKSIWLVFNVGAGFVRNMKGASDMASVSKCDNQTEILTDRTHAERPEIQPAV